VSFALVELGKGHSIKGNPYEDLFDSFFHNRADFILFFQKQENQNIYHNSHGDTLDGRSIRNFMSLIK
jgi:hypothetical protein